MSDRPQKVTIAELREMGVRGLLVYCADYRCSHSIAISGEPLADDLPGVRPSAGFQLEPSVARRKS
jgi:hypothetical protein